VEVRRALLRVPPRQREVLVLAYGVGLSLKEIAGQLRLPLGTAKSRLARGRQVLARAARRRVRGIGHA
jgi:RNA polymerase sigma-70 factor (ECF subfamily)